MDETPKLSFNFPSVRLLLLAYAVLAAVAFVSGAAFAADSGARVDRADLRIQDMHAKLQITAEQEAQWGKVAEVMRDNAKVMDTLTQARMDHAKEMTAIDDLKSYGEIAAAHADGINKLIPVFADSARLAWRRGEESSVPPFVCAALCVCPTRVRAAPCVL